MRDSLHSAALILTDAASSELCQWLWSKVLNIELQNFMKFRNGVRMRKDKSKPGPSGMSRNQAFSDPASWGGEDFLMKIPDITVIHELKKALGGDELLMFTSSEFDAQAQTVFDQLEISNLRMEMVWTVFTAMYHIMSV